MNGNIEKLIQYIRSGTPIDAIKSDLNLTNKQLMYYYRLIKDMGYSLTKKYYSDGSSLFDFENLLVNDTKNIKGIYTKNNEDTFRCVVISDLHLFHQNDSQKSIDSIFNYCIENNINTILICGDLINGGDSEKISIYDEASSFVALYPYDKSINTICILGNHDYNFFKKTGIDLGKYIDDRRSDILPLGYGYGVLGIKNDYIILKHPINDLIFDHGKENKYHPAKIQLFGHSHFYKIDNNIIRVPSLSDVKTNNLIKNICFSPQALDICLSFLDGAIKAMTIDHLVVDQTCMVISESIVHLNPNCDCEKYKFSVDDYPTKMLSKN